MVNETMSFVDQTPFTTPKSFVADKWKALSIFGIGKRNGAASGHDPHFSQVAAFLSRFTIEATPKNYELIYRFCVGNEMHLLPMVNELIANGHFSSVDDFAQQGSALEEELGQLADDTQQQLAIIETIVAKSRSETVGYSNALEGAALNMGGDDLGRAAMVALIELTKAMVVTTRSVEGQLRERSEAIETLQTSLRDARTKADTDALTGLSNRRAFERHLGAACERSKTSGNNCVLAICDIDRFKSINDEFGHPTGDRVIKLVANILAEHCHQSGHVYRFGGEEFVVLFENLKIEEAAERIDAARSDLSQRNIIHKETRAPLNCIAFSAGLSDSANQSDPGLLLAATDKALYRAKADGRNCIRLAEEADQA